jgi:hypothetical protein
MVRLGRYRAIATDMLSKKLETAANFL